MFTMTTAIFTIIVILLVVLTTTSAYAGGPRLDYPDDATAEGADCYVNGYDAGFAGKYDKNRADECKENGEDNYNYSWSYGCKDAGYMIDECESFKNNPVDTGNPNSLEEENRRNCYDDGYEDGDKNIYDRERESSCSEFGGYRNGFMAACQFGNTYSVCNSLTEPPQTNITAIVTINEQSILDSNGSNVHDAWFEVNGQMHNYTIYNMSDWVYQLPPDESGINTQPFEETFVLPSEQEALVCLEDSLEYKSCQSLPYPMKRSETISFLYPAD
jgi:hypothetical protein